MGKRGGWRVGQIKRLESAKKILKVFVTQDLSGSEFRSLRGAESYMRTLIIGWRTAVPVHPRVNEAREVLQHGATVMRYEHPPLTGGQRQYLRVRPPNHVA